jgi:cysteinyl-tRNA synthetase
MAKSVGNIFLLHQAIETYGRDALLMYFCSGHYRQPIEFDAERLEEASRRVARVREAARRLGGGASPPWSAPLRDEFFAALREDFNTPRALAAVFEWAREANRSARAVGAADLRAMLEERRKARARRDFAEADALRDRLRELGWEVRDGPDGAELLPVP